MQRPPGKLNLCVQSIPTSLQRINWNAERLSFANKIFVKKLVQVKCIPFSEAYSLLKSAHEQQDAIETTSPNKHSGEDESFEDFYDNLTASREQARLLRGSSSSAAQNYNNRKRFPSIAHLERMLHKISEDLSGSDVRICTQFHKWTEMNYVCIAFRGGWNFEWDIHTDSYTPHSNNDYFECVVAHLIRNGGIVPAVDIRKHICKALKLESQYVADILTSFVANKWIERGRLARYVHEHIWFGVRTLIEHPRVVSWYREMKHSDDDFHG